MATLNKDQNEVKPLNDEELDQAAGGRANGYERFKTNRPIKDK